MNLATLAVASPGSSLYESMLAQVRAAEAGASAVEFAEPSGVAGIDFCETCGAETRALRKGQCEACR